MNIQIRVIAAQAQKQLAAIQAQTRGVGAAGRGAAGGMGVLNNALNPARMIKFGSQTQWTGRQLTRNFTFPLLAAGAAATKFALDNEAGFKRIVKVYGDGSQSAQQITNETNALRGSFEALSNEFGVNQSEVLKVAGDWAAAGASGLALARATKLTLQTMVLGEIDAGKATEALVAIQAQYGQQVGELGAKHVGAATDVNTLAETIGVLNIVENQTGVSMAGLIDSLSRSAGVARSSGVSIRQLAAMTAALVPAAGSAAAAGNALKTMFSRMMSPTQEAGQVLHEMGVNFDENAWKSKNAAERLIYVADQYRKLGDGVTKTSAVLDKSGKPTGRFISAQQAVASSVIASRWQINRFDVLMGSLTDKTGYYAKAMNGSASANANAAQAQKELNIVLESSPHRLQQMGVILKNSMADVIQPMIPAIVILASYIARLGTAFSNMNPTTQKFIVIGLAMLAIMGPILIFFGSLVTALGEISKMFLFATKPLVWFSKGLWAIASAPFKLIALGFRGIGTGAMWSIGALRAGIAAMAQHVVMATYSGGIQGALARKIVAAWTFMRTAVVLNFTMMRVVAIAEVKKMVAAFAVFMERNLQTSFVATMARMRALFVQQLAGMVMAAQAGFAAMLAPVRLWALRQVVMVQTAMMAGRAVIIKRLGEMIAAMTVGMATMLRPVFLWGASTVGIFGTAMAFMEGRLAMAMARMSALWTAALVKWAALVAVNGRRIPAIWAAINESMIAIQAFASRGLTRIMAAGQAAMAAVTAAGGGAITGIATFINTKLLAIWIAGSTRLRGLWTIVWGGMTAIKAAASARILAISVAMQTRMFAINALGLARLRALWLASMAAMMNPTVLLRNMASFATGFAQIIPMVSKIGRALFAALTGPVGLAVLAAIAIFYGFRKQLGQLWANIGEMMKGSTGAFSGPIGVIQRLWENLGVAIHRVFNALPDGVANALLAVVRIVKAAAMKVYELFQYLNPFAHHSPSLVENVTGGMAQVQRMYGETGDAASAMATGVSRSMAQVRREASITADSYAGMIDTANKMAASLSTAAANVGSAGKYTDERKDVAKVAPAQLGTFDSLVKQLGPLNTALDTVQKAENDQQAVVNRWQQSLDAANTALDTQQNKLSDLKDNLDVLQTAYDAAKQKMSDFASAPIEGMGAMSDAIFDNQMAQKKLQLQIMQWEDVNGSLDDTKKKIDLLAGAIETGQADIADLRQGGAGSDILGPMNDQLDAMVKQRDQLEKAVQDSPVTDMQKQLDALGKKGQELDLENSIKFDPLTRQIDQLANGMKELPFDTIVAGINKQKSAMDDLQPKIDAATAAIDKQQTAVDAAQKARDAAQASYDAESNRLDVLKQKYSDLADAISNVKQALGDISGAASGQLEAARQKKESISPGLQNFRDAAGGSFPDQGGQARIGQEGSLDPKKQLDEINAFTMDSTKNLEDSFGKLDLLDPFKKKWAAIKQWWNLYIQPFFEPLGQLWKGVVGSIDWSAPFDSIFKSDQFTSAGDKFIIAWNKVKDAFSTVWGVIKKIMDLFAPDIRRVIDEIIKVWGKMVDHLGPEVKKWGELLGPFLTALRNFAAIIGVYLLYVAKIFTSVIGHTIGPVFDLLIGIIQNALQIIRGLVEIFTGIFTLNFSMMAKGVGDIFGGLFGIIWDIIKNGIDIVLGVIEGFVGGVVGFFKWLFDVLVGHSIIPDMMKEIVSWFEWLIDPVKAALKLVWDGISWAWDHIAKPVFTLMTLEIKAWAAIFKWVWDNILQPAFKLWWSVMSTLWNTVGKVVFTVIETYLKTWATIFKWIWDNVIQPAFKIWWSVMTTLWNTVGKVVFDVIEAYLKAWAAIFTWVWDHLIKPAFSLWWSVMSTVWTTVGKVVFTVIEAYLKAWAAIFSWVWDHVIKPAWNAIWSGLESIWNKVGKPIFQRLADGIVNIINTAIGAVNTLGNAIEKVGGVIGLKFSIPDIPKLTAPKFAEGGALPTRVGSGLVTNRARAIVGEGSNQYPEYVIPTDPRYRNRAKDLYNALGARIGGVPAYKGGGILDAAKGIGGDLVSPLVTGAKATYEVGKEGVGILRKGAVMAAFAAPLAIANKMIGLLGPMPMAQRMVTNFKNDVYNWAKGQNDKADATLSATGGNAPVPGTGWSAITNWLVANSNVPYRVTATTGGQHAEGSYHYLGRAVDLAGEVPGHDTPQLLAINKALMPIAKTLTELIYAGPGGLSFKNGQPFEYSAAIRADHHDHVHAALASGAILKGPVHAMMGEAGHEVVAPLTPLWNRLDRIEARQAVTNTDNGGDTIININGNLEFPNISSGDDAESFVRNLQIAARK